MAKAKEKETENEVVEIKAEEEKSTAVAKKSDAALPAYFQQDLGGFDGLDEVEAEDIRIPFLKVLQSNSAQLKKQESEYIKGAEQGDFCLTSVGLSWPGEEGIYVIPVKLTMRYIEWEHMDGGGAKFVASHDKSIKDSCTRVDESKRKGWFLDGGTGNEIVKTADWFCIIYDTKKKEAHQAVLSLKKTGLKAHGDMSTVLKGLQVNGQKIPAYQSIFKASSYYETNDANSWYALKMQRLGFLHQVAGLDPDFEGEVFLDPEEAEKLVNSGKGMLQAVKENKVKAEDEKGIVEQEGSASSDDTEDEIPF